MKKVLLTTAIVTAMIAPAMADDDLVMKLPTGKICQFKNGKATLHGSCRDPKAYALVRRSNRLVKGHPTCAQLFFFSSRRRHTRLTCDWSSDVALPILSMMLEDSTSIIDSDHLLITLGDRV